MPDRMKADQVAMLRINRALKRERNNRALRNASKATIGELRGQIDAVSKASKKRKPRKRR